MTLPGLLSDLCGVLGAATVERNVELLTNPETRLWLAMQEMQRQPQLSGVEAQARVACPRLREGSGRQGGARHHPPPPLERRGSPAQPRRRLPRWGGSAPRAVLGAAFRSGQPPISARRMAAATAHPMAAAMARRDREESVQEIATTRIGSDEARALRAGRKTNPAIEGLELQSWR